MPLWTQEQDEELKALYTQGLSCREIAARIGDGKSRNAVIGRSQRLNLELRGPTPKNPIKKKRIRSGRGKHSHAVYKISFANGNSNKLRIIESRAFKHEQKLRCVEIVPLRIPLLDLTDDMCRYPFDGEGDEPATVFCGYPKQHRSSFCTPHHHLCWEPPGTAPRGRVSKVSSRILEVA